MAALYLLLKFLIGGSLLLGITLLADHIHPKWGGALAVAPVLTTLSIVFVYAETNVQTTQHLILSAIYFIIPTLLFLIIMYVLLSRFNLLYSFLIAYFLWGLCVYVLQKVLY
ncbi:MAG: DUF3147 family protein [Candidatus Woesearchaeota archaeon]